MKKQEIAKNMKWKPQHSEKELKQWRKEEGILKSKCTRGVTETIKRSNEEHQPYGGSKNIFR